MAITFYTLNTTAVSPNYWGNMQVGGTAPSGANSAFGFMPGTTALTSPFYRGRLGASGTNSTALASSYVDAATGPVHGTGTTASTAGDSFVAGPFNGTFGSSSWTFNWNMRASVVGAVGRIRMRVWKSVNADGSSASELTSGALVGATVTLSTTADVNSQITWTPGAFDLSNEYLFFQLEWEETTQGSSGTNNVLFRRGTTTIAAPAFTYTLVANNLTGGHPEIQTPPDVSLYTDGLTGGSPVVGHPKMAINAWKGQILTSGTSFNRPADWNDSSNEVHAIGGGGNEGGAGQSSGGGGAYAMRRNVTLDATTAYRIGTNGGTTGSGTTPTANTYFKDASTLIAAGGASATSTTGGAGGAEANCVGDVVHHGGKAGDRSTYVGGGGGAGGPNGPGNDGENGSTGGVGGAADVVGGSGVGNDGTVYGGEGGSFSPTAIGGVGGNGYEWGSVGSGGGAGGDDPGSYAGNNGGYYGGGGSRGSGSGRVGRPGVIAIFWDSGQAGLIIDDLITGAPELGTPELTINEEGNSLPAADNLTNSAPTFGTPAITQLHVLPNATNLTNSAPTFGTPALTQNHTLQADNLSGGQPTIGTVALVQQHVLPNAASLTNSAPTFGGPAFGQVHKFSALATLSNSAPTFGTPALTQNHTLQADNLSGGQPVFGTPLCGQNEYYDLEIAAGFATGSPTVVARPVFAITGGVIQPNSLTNSAPVIGSPALTQVHVFAAPATLSSGQPFIGTTQCLIGVVPLPNAINLSNSAPTLGAPAFTQQHVLPNAVNLTNSAPQLASFALTYNFTATSFIAGAPVLPSYKITYNFTATSLTNSAAALPSFALSYNFTATGLSNSAPPFATSALTQVHVFAAPAMLSSGAPVFGTTQVLVGTVPLPDAINLTNSAPTLGSPVFSQKHVLPAASFVNTGATLPSFGLTYNFTATSFANSAAALPNYRIIYNVPATSFTAGVPTFGSPAVVQKHVLQATNLTGGQPFIGTSQCLIGVVPLPNPNSLSNSAPIFGAPVLTQKHVLPNAVNLTNSAPLLPNFRVVYNFAAPATLSGGHPSWTAPVLTKTLTAIGLTNSAPTLGGPVFHEKNALPAATGVTSGAPTFGTPELSIAGVTLTALPLTGGQPTFGTPTSTQVHKFAAPATLTSGHPVIGTTQCLIGVIPLQAANFVNSSPVFGAPVFNQKQALPNATSLVNSGPSLGAATFAQVHKFAAPATLSSGHPTWTAPVLTKVLAANGLTNSAPVFGTPVLHQKQVLQAVNLTNSAPLLPAANFSQAGVIAAVGVTSGHPTFGAPELTRNVHLEAAPLTNSAPELPTLDMGQNYSFVATALIVAPVLYAVPVTQDHVLAPANLFQVHPPVLGTPKFKWNGYFPPSQIMLVSGRGKFEDRATVDGLSEQPVRIAGRATFAAQALSGRDGTRQIRNII